MSRSFIARATENLISNSSGRCISLTQVKCLGKSNTQTGTLCKISWLMDFKVLSHTYGNIKILYAVSCYFWVK